MAIGDHFDMDMDLGSYKASRQCASCRKCCVFPVPFCLACKMVVLLHGFLLHMQFCVFSQCLFSAFSTAFSILRMNSHGFAQSIRTVKIYLGSIVWVFCLYHVVVVCCWTEGVCFSAWGFSSFSLHCLRYTWNHYFHAGRFLSETPPQITSSLSASILPIPCRPLHQHWKCWSCFRCYCFAVELEHHHHHLRYRQQQHQQQQQQQQRHQLQAASAAGVAAPPPEPPPVTPSTRPAGPSTRPKHPSSDTKHQSSTSTTSIANTSTGTTDHQHMQALAVTAKAKSWKF